MAVILFAVQMHRTTVQAFAEAARSTQAADAVKQVRRAAIIPAARTPLWIVLEHATEMLFVTVLERATETLFVTVLEHATETLFVTVLEHATETL